MTPKIGDTVRITHDGIRELVGTETAEVIALDENPVCAFVVLVRSEKHPEGVYLARWEFDEVEQSRVAA